MRAEAWLTVSRRGTVRARTRGRPSVGPNEVLVKVRINIPDEAFRTAQFIADVDGGSVQPVDVTDRSPDTRINTDEEQI
jgi:hypothetical protein